MPPDSRTVLLDALPGPAQEALVRFLDRRGAGRLRLTCRACRDTVDASTERLELAVITPRLPDDPRLRQRQIAIEMEPLCGLLRRCARVRSVDVHCDEHASPVLVGRTLAALSRLKALEVGARAGTGSGSVALLHRGRGNWARLGLRRTRHAHAPPLPPPSHPIPAHRV
jgi:hypothetical protein